MTAVTANTAEAAIAGDPDDSLFSQIPPRILGWGFVLLGIVFPLLGYVVLPFFNINIFLNLLSFEKLAMLLLLFFGGVIYCTYFQFIIARPTWLLCFISLFWSLTECASFYLLTEAGINIKLRMLCILGLALPGLWLILQNGWTVLKNLPHAKWYVLFFLWLTIYMFFNNANARDYTAPMDNVFFDGSIAIIQYFAYFYGMLSMLLAGSIMLQKQAPERFFDGFNKALFVITAVESVITVICYPLGLLSMNLDGFHRAYGIFTHPNPYAHHMGILMVYQLAMWFYYQNANPDRMNRVFFWGTFISNAVGFVIGLSLTSFTAFGLAMMLLVLGNLTSWKAFRNLLLTGAGMIVLLVIGMLLFQVLTEQNFLSVLENRLASKESVNWRTQVWGFLMSNVDAASILLGHGFTAANAWIFMVSYNDKTNATPLMQVHNGYIGLLYDLGILGYAIFFSVVSLVYHSALKLFKAMGTQHRALWVSVIGLSAYYLLVCAADEMVYMFDAALQFWLLATLTFTMGLRHYRQPILESGR